MSIGCLDLNLVHRAAAGRGGLVLIVAPDTICGTDAAADPLLAVPHGNFVPMEGDPSRRSCPAKISDYGRCRLAEPIGVRIDLKC